MRHRQLRAVLAICLLVQLSFLAGCGGRIRKTQPVEAPVAEPVVDPATQPTQKGALAALSAYAEARRNLNVFQAYSLLAPSAQAAFTAGEFAGNYTGQKSYLFKGVEVDSPKDGLARGYVLELAVTGSKTYKYAKFPYTLRFEGGRWGVAQATGLAPRALKAFDAGKWDEDLKVVELWLTIDPNAWDAYLERFYVYKDTDQPQKAKEAWEKALELAPPEERPELYDILAMLYSFNRQGEPLAETVQKALDSAAKLGKEHADRYDLRWRAGVVIDLAFAYRYQGDEKKAFQYFQEARALDPKNRDVERFARAMPAR